MNRPYVARHLGAPDTSPHAQVREQVAGNLAAADGAPGIARSTLVSRGRHAAYRVYRPHPLEARRPVDRATESAVA